MRWYVVSDPCPRISCEMLSGVANAGAPTPKINTTTPARNVKRRTRFNTAPFDRQTFPGRGEFYRAALYALRTEREQTVTGERPSWERWSGSPERCDLRGR